MTYDIYSTVVWEWFDSCLTLNSELFNIYFTTLWKLFDNDSSVIAECFDSYLTVTWQAFDNYWGWFYSYPTVVY